MCRLPLRVEAQLKNETSREMESDVEGFRRLLGCLCKCSSLSSGWAVVLINGLTNQIFLTLSGLASPQGTLYRTEQWSTTEKHAMC